MTALPAILTVAQILRTRRGCTGLIYRGCLLKFIDWHPAPDGTHHAVTTDDTDHFLTPETWLEENNDHQFRTAQTGTK